MKLVSKTYTSDDNWKAPHGVTFAIIEGIGAGGGGGAGSGKLGGGHAGAGGGGAKYSKCIVIVVPGTTYTITIGLGGGGGTGGSGVGPPGNDGGNSTFGALATFVGAGLGGGGSITSNDSIQGGFPVKNNSVFTTQATIGVVPGPGCGGWGTRVTSSAQYRYGGGTAASIGAANGADNYAFGGGGGGASEWQGNVPGIGGASSTINNVGGDGDPGTLGAGGGGGAGGGNGFNGGSGGAGGNGAIRVSWFE